MLCGSLDGKGVWGRMDTRVCIYIYIYIYIYIWLSPFAVYVKLSQHCLLIGYAPVQNKKL